jgi:hypothetical protein
MAGDTGYFLMSSIMTWSLIFRRERIGMAGQVCAASDRRVRIVTLRAGKSGMRAGTQINLMS